MTKTFIHPVSQLLYKVRHIEVKAKTLKKGKCFNRLTQRQTSEKINNLIRNEVTVLVDVRYMGFVEQHYNLLYLTIVLKDTPWQ